MIKLGEPIINLFNEVDVTTKLPVNQVKYVRYTKDSSHWIKKSIYKNGTKVLYWSLVFPDYNTDVDMLDNKGRLIETYVIREDNLVYICTSFKKDCIIRVIDKSNNQLSSSCIHNIVFDFNINYDNSGIGKLINIKDKFNKYRNIAIFNEGAYLRLSCRNNTLYKYEKYIDILNDIANIDFQSVDGYSYINYGTNQQKVNGIAVYDMHMAYFKVDSIKNNTDTLDINVFVSDVNVSTKGLKDSVTDAKLSALQLPFLTSELYTFSYSNDELKNAPVADYIILRE
jgi:hypothetical protein